MSRFRITPIGTCRIHTPLRRASSRYPVQLDLRRNYGFVHTSDEALQLLKFLQGEKQFSSQAAPLVFRDGDQGRFEAEDWSPSDLHIVEISSSKRIRCGSDVVQGNYVQRYFSDFFASRERARQFWNLVKMGHRQDLIDFLTLQPSYNLLSADDRQLLSELSMEQLSFKAIKSDMAEILDRLGRDKVLFVTHINALMPDGERIPTRDRLIRWVKMAAEQLGAPIFDPTDVMNEVGQEAALENGGLDLTHYNLPFSDRLYDRLHQSHVAERVSAHASPSEDAGREQEAANLALRLESELVQGDFFGASRNVHQALENQPNSLPLIELRGLIRAKIGDYSNALNDLTHRAQDELLSQNMRLALMDALNHQGRHDAALQVAKQLIADEFEDASVYRSAAMAAEKSDRNGLAIRYFKEASRRDRGDLSTALHALVLLKQKSETAEADEWRREMLENIGNASSGAFELASWAIENRDEDLFAAAFKKVIAVDKAGSVDLAEDVLAASLFHGAASTIPLLAQLGKLPTSLSTRRNAILNNAIELMGALLEQDKPADAYELARALTQLGQFPAGQIATEKLEAKARRAMVQITRHVRSSVRSAFGTGNPEQVVEEAAGTLDILAGDPDTAVIVARSLDSIGRQNDALALLRRVQADNPGHFGSRRLGARYAALQGDYATALDLYGSMKSFEDFPAAKPEVERFFNSVERRALKQLRSLTDAGRYDEGLALAAAIARQLGPLERTERELLHMSRRLRLQLKEVEDGGSDLEDRESILRKLIEIGSDKEKYLRRLALELMRQFRFAEAAEIWEQLYLVDPANESAERNRVRCATLAERRALDSGREITQVG